MHHTHSAIKKYIVLTAIFFLLVLFLPANSVVLNLYDLSSDQYRALIFIIALPLGAIWLAAFYAYAKLADYAHTVRKTPEGPGFADLTRGLTWLAWGLPIPAIITIITNAAADNRSAWRAANIILTNYLNMAFAFIAFLVIYRASVQLMQQSKTTRSKTATRSLQTLFVIIGLCYCYFTLRNLNLGDISATDNPYHLPVWLFVPSVIAPFLVAWFMGLTAAYNIALVARSSKGLIYRTALRYLAWGIGLVIPSLVSVQYIRTVVPRTGHVSLNLTLLITYSIYVIAICGFACVAAGAKRLQKLEEV